jgi:hypothetical protein
MNSDGSAEKASSASADPDGRAAGSAGHTGDDIVTVAKRRFAAAESFYGQARQLAIADTRFVMGDSDNGWQWPDNYWIERGSEGRVRLTVNATAQHCNQIINNIRQGNPQVKISPVDDHADKRTAEMLAGLVRNVLASSDADTAHDIGAEHAIYGGEGYWRVDTEYEHERSFNQRIVVKPIPNPNLVYVDPSAIKPDRSDAKWCFVFEDLTHDQFRAEFGDTVEMSSWIKGPEDTWYGEDRVRVADYFWCEYIADELWFVPEADRIILKSEAAKEFPGIKRPQHWRKTKRTQWKRARLVGAADEPHEQRDWPGKFMPVITVVGKELNITGTVIRKGQVRDLKDPARMLNYAYSEAVETLAIQNKVPYMASAEAIEGFEEEWKAANKRTTVYLPFNAYDEAGNALPRPSKEPPPQMAMAQVQLLQMSTEQMRAASGQQNANFGIKSEASSGVGIQRLKVQGDTATFHFPDNLRRALRYEAEVIVDLIQKIYDTRRVERVLGLDGKEEIATLDPNLPGAYAEQPKPPPMPGAPPPSPDERRSRSADIERIFNPTVGLYDIVIDTGPSYQTQRQEAFAAMTETAGRDATFMAKAGDILWKAADFPMADQVAERYERTMPPELRSDDDPIKGMQQQLQQMQQGLQEAVTRGQKAEAEALELKRKLDGKVIENNAKVAIEQGAQRIEAYKAETDRMATLGPAIDPQAIAAMAAQLVMQTLSGPTLDDATQGGMPQGDMQPPPDLMQDPGAAMQPADPSMQPPGLEPGGALPPSADATGAQPGLGPMPA